VFWYCPITGSGQKYTFLIMSKVNNNGNNTNTSLSALQKDVSVYYSGSIDMGVMLQLLAKAEACLGSSEFSGSKKSHVLSVMIELLQNIQHHCPVNIATTEDSPIFLLKKQPYSYTIITSNLVEKNNAIIFKNRVAELNAYTQEELIYHYRQILRNGTLNNSGAGLGLIDIIRKSGNAIGIDFTSKDNKYDRVTVNVAISLSK
jgi:hypothetical protein